MTSMLMARGGIRFIALAGLVFLAAAPASTHPRPYEVRLSAARVSKLEGGRVVISMDAQGDLRGMLTLTLEPDGETGVMKGEWALVVAYVQDLNPDGSVAPPAEPEHHNEAGEGEHYHEGGEGEPHHERIRFVNDGTLSGKAFEARLSLAHDGRITGIESAQLSVDQGSLRFAGATGNGFVVAASLDDVSASTGAVSLIF